MLDRFIIYYDFFIKLKLPSLQKGNIFPPISLYMIGYINQLHWSNQEPYLIAETQVGIIHSFLCLRELKDIFMIVFETGD